MGNAVMRTRKDGGCSLCRASENNVGKKRCCHILDNAAIQVRHEKGINFIDITGQFDNKDVEISMKANQSKIKDFISTLSSSLSKKEHDDILSILREG